MLHDTVPSVPQSLQMLSTVRKLHLSMRYPHLFDTRSQFRNVTCPRKGVKQKCSEADR